MVDHTPFGLHISVAESRTENVTSIINYIRDKQLKRTQFVSLSTSESQIEDGEHVIALVYKRETGSNGGLPLDTIEHNPFTDTMDWSELTQELEKMSGHDVLSVTHTARNIGDRAEQIMWHFKEGAGHTVNTEVFTSEDRNWEGLVEQALHFLNSHVAPHQLVSISMTEEHIPNDGGK